MAFFYGLVSQRGPWKETAADYMRLTRPQFQDAVDPNTTNEANTEKLRLQQRTSGITGSRGSDLRSAPAINGLEKSLGISNELVNIFAEKTMDPAFTNGSSGGVEQTFIVADFLNKIRQSTMYNYVIPILEKSLYARLENTKDRVPYAEFQKLNKLIFGVDVDRQTANELIALNIKILGIQDTVGVEQAHLNVMSTTPPRLKPLLQKIFDGQLVLPSNQMMYNENAHSIKEDLKNAPVDTGSASPDDVLGLGKSRPASPVTDEGAMMDVKPPSSGGS